LAKNKVYRLPPLEQAQAKEEALAQVEQERRAMKYQDREDIEEERVLIPEIELAIYWDRHAYEYRRRPTNPHIRSPSPSQPNHNHRPERKREMGNCGNQGKPETRDSEAQCNTQTVVVGKCEAGSQTSFRRECRCYCKDCKPKARAKSAAPKLVRAVQSQTNTNGNHTGYNGKNGISKTEYKVKFRNPSRIADSANRILKKKILNRCCNESIF
jgi:hypothetical protein